MTYLPLYPLPQEQYRFPVPHSGSDVSLSDTECQPSLPEPHGRYQGPFQPSETRTQSRGLWPPLWQHLALGLLPVVWTDSDIYLVILLASLSECLLLVAPTETTGDFHSGAWTVSSEASCPSLLSSSQNCVPLYDDASPSGLPRP